MDARTVGDELIGVTIRRLHTVTLIALPVHLVHLVVFWSTPTPTPAEERWRLGILGAHGALLVVMGVLAVVTARLRQRTPPGRAGHAVTWVALVAVLLAGGVIATVDQWVTPSILPFLIACLVVGLVFLVRPRLVVFAYLGALGLFVVVLGWTQSDPVVLLSNRVNAVTSAALGFGLSFLMWRAEARNARQQHELEARNRELLRLATTDALTGLVNRRQMDTSIRSELDRMARFGHASSLMLIDVDDFKRVNDERGHLTGDRVLQELAGIMGEQLRTVDVLARWGGEEFAVLLPETGAEEAVNTAERLRAGIQAHPLQVDGTHIPLTVSIGVAPLVRAAGPGGRDEPYRAVDQALYTAKRRGRNRVVAAKTVRRPEAPQPA